MIGDWRTIIEAADAAWTSIDEASDAPVPAPVALPAEPAFRVLLDKTPWWAISACFHAAAVLIMSFMWVVVSMPEDSLVVVTAPRKPRTPPRMEPPSNLEPLKNLLDMKEPVDDPVYRKNAEPSDRNETDDLEDFQRTRGDSPDAASDKPFVGRGRYDMVGAAGAGGRFGSRLGGKRNLVSRGGGGAETEQAVLGALIWLARHQSSDGSWEAKGYLARCVDRNCGPAYGQGTYDSGLTGLALLAFLGAGYTHLSRETHGGVCFGDVVRNALQWMIRMQNPQGSLDGHHGCNMYNESICALALSEAFGLTGSPLVKQPAQKAIDFLIFAQNPGSGWRYRPRSGDSDTSVTGWAVMALKSAEMSGLTFGEGGYAGARAWLDRVTDNRYGTVGYESKGDARSGGQAMTAVGVMSRIFIDKSKEDARLGSGCDMLLRRKPDWEDRERDFYYWYYASLALYQYDGPTGPKWKSWNGDMKNALVKNQKAQSVGCAGGSWEPVDRWSHAGGRIYATAINCLTLEVYYRYASVFGGR